MRKHSATLRNDSAVAYAARENPESAALAAMAGTPLTPQARRKARAIAVSTFGDTASTRSTSSRLLLMGSSISLLSECYRTVIL